MKLLVGLSNPERKHDGTLIMFSFRQEDRK